jgi:hypothetical protein
MRVATAIVVDIEATPANDPADVFEAEPEARARGDETVSFRAARTGRGPELY